MLTCATAGVDFGYDLAWVLLFAVGATFVLQSFTAGTGILAGMGVGEAMREATRGHVQRVIVFSLVILGLWIGAAAFETGNLLGAAAGLEILTGGALRSRLIVVLLTVAAAVILVLDLKVLTTLLAALVALMSVVFIATAILAPVDWNAVVRGVAVPSIPAGAILRVVALIGTTVVAYNLFLHASATKGYWAGTEPHQAWRREMIGMAIFLPAGGIISIAILIAGASLAGTGTEVNSIADLAPLIEPAAGPAAGLLFGLGLAAAGVTSAITAPLAAALGVREIFNWSEDPKHIGFRGVWLSVLATGLVFALIGHNPLEIIIAAQAANGLLLPFMAGFVLYLTARQSAVRLPKWYLAVGVVVTVICAALGWRTLAWVWSQIGL